MSFVLSVPELDWTTPPYGSAAVERALNKRIAGELSDNVTEFIQAADTLLSATAEATAGRQPTKNAEFIKEWKEKFEKLLEGFVRAVSEETPPGLGLNHV